MNGITTSTECFGAEYYTNKVYDMFMRLDDSGKLFEPEQTFTRTGIAANVNEWLCAKRHLFDLFRRHPNWNEEAKAIVFLNSEHREPDAQTVKKIGQRIINNAFMTSAHYDQLIGILDDITSMNSLNVLDEWIAKRINSAYPSVKAVKGQKTSRIINKLFTMLEADKLLYNYNSLFAKLADACNPLTVERITVFSLNIIDFLLMSNGNSWSNCLTLTPATNYDGFRYKGKHKAGTLSYMTDEVSCLFYTLDKNSTGPLWSIPKITRQVIFYRLPLIVHERIYPKSVEYIDEPTNLYVIYKNAVQKLLSECEGIENQWEYNDTYIKRSSNCFVYPDWKYYTSIRCVNLSVSRSFNSITVGGKSYCIHCGDPKYKCDDDSCATLLCEDCEEENDE